MGRVIAVGEGGRPQAPVRDDRFREVIEAVLARGLLGRPLLTPVCATWEQADETRRGLYRSARHYCSCGQRTCARRHRNYPAEPGHPAGCPRGGQRVSARADVVRDQAGKYRVQVTLWQKTAGMASVASRHGTDPASWPYNPRARRITKE